MDLLAIITCNAILWGGLSYAGHHYVRLALGGAW